MLKNMVAPKRIAIGLTFFPEGIIFRMSKILPSIGIAMIIPSFGLSHNLKGIQHIFIAFFSNRSAIIIPLAIKT
jgi:hypothetical protein